MCRSHSLSKNFSSRIGARKYFNHDSLSPPLESISKSLKKDHWNFCQQYVVSDYVKGFFGVYMILQLKDGDCGWLKSLSSCLFDILPEPVRRSVKSRATDPTGFLAWRIGHRSRRTSYPRGIESRAVVTEYGSDDLQLDMPDWKRVYLIESISKMD